MNQIINVSHQYDPLILWQHLFQFPAMMENSEILREGVESTELKFSIPLVISTLDLIVDNYSSRYNERRNQLKQFVAQDQNEPRTRLDHHIPTTFSLFRHVKYDARKTLRCIL